MKRAAWVALALALALALPAPLPAAQDLPPPDETASFEGSWYYVDPEFKIAIFIAQETPEALSIRYHVRGKRGGDYETDAQGKAKYLDSGNLVEILFTGRRTATNRID